MRAFWVLSVVGFASLGACGGKVAAAETALSGTTALTSYPATPTAIVATDETGRSIRATLTSAGNFSVTLPSSHKYKLSILTATGAVPLVFPRANGKLDASFSVKSNGAKIALGSVRYLPGAPPSGFRVTSTTGGGSGSGADANCENCVDDNQAVSCQDGQEGQNDGEDGVTEAGDLADGNHEMAVADHNAPDSIDGCSNESSGDNNNNNNNDDNGHH